MVDTAKPGNDQLMMDVDVATIVSSRKPEDIIITMLNYGQNVYFIVDARTANLEAIVNMPEEYHASEVVHELQPCKLAFLVFKGHDDANLVEKYVNRACYRVKKAFGVKANPEETKILEDSEKYRVILQNTVVFPSLRVMREFVKREVFAEDYEKPTSSDYARVEMVGSEECVLWNFFAKSMCMVSGKEVSPRDFLLGEYDATKLENCVHANSESRSLGEERQGQESAKTEEATHHDPSEKSAPSHGQIRTPAQNTASVFMANDLVLYYGKFFPSDMLWKLFEHGSHPGSASTREFMFETGKYRKRPLSFESPAQMVSCIQRELPHAVHAGRSYTCSPLRTLMHKNYAMHFARELLFDLDLDAYNDVKTCCYHIKTSDDIKDVCDKCWCFAVCAIRAISWFLRTCMGFSHIMWVFSGRRGVHGWVLDPRATSMTDADRKCVLDRLQLVKKQGSNGTYTVASTSTAPRKAEENFARVLEPCFKNLVCEAHGVFTDTKQIKRWCDAVIYRRIGEEAMLDMLVNTPRDWDSFRKYVQTTWPVQYKRVVCDMVLLYTFPRLDAGITNSTNHMLKIPFTTHAVTTRVCLPIPEEELESIVPSVYSPKIRDVVRGDKVANHNLSIGVGVLSKLLDKLNEQQQQNWQKKQASREV